MNGNNKAQASPSLSSTPTPVETPSAVKRKRGEPKLAPPVVAKKIKEQVDQEPRHTPFCQALKQDVNVNQSYSSL